MCADALGLISGVELFPAFLKAAKDAGVLSVRREDLYIGVLRQTLNGLIDGVSAPGLRRSGKDAGNGL